MAQSVSIGDKKVGYGSPVFLVAEIGINHNGSVDTAIQLIKEIADAGFDAVKFQKRTPELCVPHEQRNIMRQTPWGLISYMDYRNKVEFSFEDYQVIDKECKDNGLIWFSSCWDISAVDFMEQFNPPCYKIASASLTDDRLLKYISEKGRPVILSTGMSTMAEIRHAVSLLNKDLLVLAHTTSTYPCEVSDLNLNMIKTLKSEFNTPVGYSGHERGLLMSPVVVGLGASFIERHVTIDCEMWGSDQAASLAPEDFKQLVIDIRIIESGMGDGVKKVYPAEKEALKKLRVCKKNPETDEVSTPELEIVQSGL